MEMNQSWPHEFFVLLDDVVRVILLYPLQVDGAIQAFRITLVSSSCPLSSYGVSSVPSTFVVMETLMSSSLRAAGLWIAVVSSFVLMPTSSNVTPVKVMSCSFAVVAGATVASSVFKVVASSLFAVVAGVTAAPSLLRC